MNRYRFFQSRILSIWYYYLITALFTGISFFQLVKTPHLNKISLGDSLVFLFLGIQPIENIGMLDVFRIPLLWLSLFIFIFYSINITIRPATGTLNYLLFFSFKKRVSFWSFKVLLTFSTVFIHFSVILLTSILCVLISGNFFSLTPTQSFSEYFIGASSSFSNVSIFTNVVFIPWLICSTLALLELLVTYFWGELQSFLCIIAYLVISAFFTSPIFLGNYLMFLRNNVMTSSLSTTQINSYTGLLISIFCLCFFYVIGWNKIKKWDYTV